MKRIIYLSLLLVIPFLVHADHGRDRLNGKWISPFHGNTIKLRVKRNKIRVKNLVRRGWTNFRPSYRGTFEDRNGNSIRINNVHELIYRSSCGRERIRFVKKGHVHHNHVCSASCEIGQDYFDFIDGCSSDYSSNDNYYNDGYGSYNDRYNNYDRYGNYDEYGGRWSERNSDRNSRRLNGEYFVREINEYVSVQSTRNGLRAKRGNRDWVNYRQNRYRKNEYIDDNGNKYLIRSNGDLTWKNNRGTVSLNLSR